MRREAKRMHRIPLCKILQTCTKNCCCTCQSACYWQMLYVIWRVVTSDRGKAAFTYIFTPNACQLYPTPCAPWHSSDQKHPFICMFSSPLTNSPHLHSSPAHQQRQQTTNHSTATHFRLPTQLFNNPCFQDPLAHRVRDKIRMLQMRTSSSHKMS